MNYDEMTADELECSDYGREYGPRADAIRALILMATVTVDWLILKGIIHAFHALMRIL